MVGAMWDEPYLETCCRSALHRLVLCGTSGRPPVAELTVVKDGPCFVRLAGLGLAAEEADGRWRATVAGRARHRSEILRADAPAGPLAADAREP